MELQQKIEAITDEMIAIRRELHQHPELGTQELETQKRISALLDKWGIEHKPCADTGIVGIIRGGKPGNVVGIRADIDDLPLQEDRSRSYCSLNDGVMHACGHDVHTTILLGVARMCKELGQELPGTVKLFFQPAEETVGGGDRMVREGCCKDPDVDYTIGLHVQPYMDVGTVEMRYGQLNASCDTVTIKVKGKAGHGAYPERGVDAIVAAAGIVSGLQTFVSRNISPLNNAVLTIGTINGGTKSNIVADEVRMTGTLRTLDPETRIFAKERITALAQCIAQGYGCTADVDVEWGYACLINTDEVVDVMKARAEELLFAQLYKSPEHLQDLKLLPQQFSSPLLGKAFRMLQQQESGQQPSLSAMAEELTAEEMSHLSRVLSDNDLLVSEETMQECAGVIRSEYQKSLLSGEDAVRNWKEQFKNKQRYGG